MSKRHAMYWAGYQRLISPKAWRRPTPGLLPEQTESLFEKSFLSASRAGDTELTNGAGDQLDRCDEIRARDSGGALAHQLGNHLLQVVRAEESRAHNLLFCARVCGRAHGRARCSNGAERRWAAGDDHGASDALH